ncbi:unnamed protein product [Cyprideis torosa]|uniref:cystathionine beta-synthase n=1 Tax=Cyprideis torosa TaxID=163714 RepID=A0A7R8W9T4_9CRUS|nr:unnamed protein product [Cyprideis torosa]CAG0884748.1 unnamed protein product [Cyprideis torosa]
MDDNQPCKESIVQGQGPWIPPSTKNPWKFKKNPAAEQKCKWSASNPEGLQSPHTRTSAKVECARVYNSVLELIGNTPLIRLERIMKSEGLTCELYAKVEGFNPGGSVKDRIAIRMVEDAERQGLIAPGKNTLIEATSGNTGIAFSLVAAVKGYHAVMLMPEKMSMEKVNSMKCLGADIIRTPTNAKMDSPDSHLALAEHLSDTLPGAVLLNQYTNASNPLAHYDETAEEIMAALGRCPDMLVAGAGTGGTLTGIGRKMKENCPSCRIVAADPAGSKLHADKSAHVECFYEIEGIGYDFNPTTLDKSVVDEWFTVFDADALLTQKRLVREEGLFIGGSSGAAAYAAIQKCKQLGPGKKVVVILPDASRNYMSKSMNNQWMLIRGIIPFEPVPLQQVPFWAVKRLKDYMRPRKVLLYKHCNMQDLVRGFESVSADMVPILKCSCCPNVSKAEGPIDGAITICQAMLSAHRVNYVQLKIGDILDVAMKIPCVRESCWLWYLKQLIGSGPEGTAAVLDESGVNFLGVVSRIDVLYAMSG